MTLYDFIQLNEKEQAEALWKATYVGSREDSEHRILLYQLDAFYVEVFYHKEQKRIRLFLPFNTSKAITPFYKMSLN